MVSVWKKARAFLLTPTGGVLTVALVCTVLSLFVLAATPIETYEATVYAGEPRLLAFEVRQVSDLDSKVGGGMIPVTLKVDGSTSVEVVRGGTVSEVLKALGVQVREYDYVSLSLTQEVEEFDEIEIRHRELEVYTVQLDIPYETHYYYSPEVRPGEELVKVEGQDGVHVETYSRIVDKGEIVEETLTDTSVQSAPVHEEILIGFKSLPVSSYDFAWSFDDSGEPIGYKNVVRSGKSAGYYAPAGAGTASGLPAQVGHVAVDPSEIPYGSKLFIQSPDGSFVYGYAIAADTGTSLVQNVIDVDLFYNTYEECVRNGITLVDIYILE